VPEGGGEGSPVAQFDFAPAAGTYVNAQLVHRDLALAFFSGGQVDGARANDAGYFALSDHHGFPGQVARIQAAHCVKTENALAVIGNQHKADFVHVGIQHYFEAWFGAGAFFGNKHITERIHLDFISVWFDFFEDELAHFTFITRNSAGKAKFFQ
jgi:hypothetical protein